MQSQERFSCWLVEITALTEDVPMSDKGIIVIYNTESNGTKAEIKPIDGNLWLTQEQIVSLYNSSKSNISEHIKHILEEGELVQEATVRKFRTVQEEGELEEVSVVRDFRTTAIDGKRYNVKHYDLDYFLKMTRKDILNGPGLVSHQEALEHARKEYETFMERLWISPTESERAALPAFEELFLLEKKGKKS